MSNYKNEIAKIAEIAEKVYLKGYWEGRGNIRKDEAYYNGLYDAWEAARKIVYPIEYGGLTPGQLSKIFGTAPTYDILKRFSATEAIENIKEYESHLPDKDVGEIKVGDEVIVRDKEKGVVTRMTPYEVTVLNTTGGGIIFTKRKNVKKTGKHYPQITEVLEQMKGDSDDCLECVKYAPTIIEADTGKAESEGSLSWLGKRCEDCGNKKCKELVELPKGYDCALWQPKVENYSIKTVTNAKEAENYPISEDISKGIEEINKLIFENGQAESEEKE